MKFLLTHVLLFISTTILLFACGNKKNNTKNATLESELNFPTEKMNGISFVSPSFLLNHEHFIPMKELHANWISNMPFGIINKDNSGIIFNSENQWESEKETGIKIALEEAKKLDLKIMLKPHLWGHDIFTGTFGFEKEGDWEDFEKNYLDFILFYAKIAENSNVDLYCIGTELARFVRVRPKFWKKLIEEVKKVYHGKLTYAENWDAVERFPYWSSLDYIGSDAYYSLTDKEYPSVLDFKEGWKPWKLKLKTLSEKYKKQIIFTEWGYRSCVFNGLKPWSYSEKLKVSEKNQVNAYTAVFETIYSEDWFAGGFIWKWFPYKNSGGADDDRYTPQNKLAEKTIKEFFNKSVNQ